MLRDERRGGKNRIFENFRRGRKKKIGRGCGKRCGSRAGRIMNLFFNQLGKIGWIRVYAKSDEIESLKQNILIPYSEKVLCPFFLKIFENPHFLLKVTLLRFLVFLK